jgi:hypothetical protein
MRHLGMAGGVAFAATRMMKATKLTAAGSPVVAGFRSDRLRGGCCDLRLVLDGVTTTPTPPCKPARDVTAHHVWICQAEGALVPRAAKYSSPADVMRPVRHPPLP